MTTEQELQSQKKRRKEIILDEALKVLRKEIRNLWDDRNNNDRTLKQKINEAAQRLKLRILEEGGSNEDIKTICVIIMDWYDTGGDEGLGHYIEEVLPSEFKREYNRTTINHSEQRFKECAVKSKSFIEFLEKLRNENPYRFGRGGAQDIAQLLYTVKNKIEDWADEAGVPLPYQNTGPKDEKRRKVQLRAAEVTTDEWIRAAEVSAIRKLDALQKKMGSLKESIEVYHFISKNHDTEEENVFRDEALDWLLKPITDDKWQRDWWEWCEILNNYHEQGGTYASSKSAVDSTLVDPKTGNPIQRKITKEQIDASHDEYLNLMCFMVRNLGQGGKFGRQQEDEKNELDNTVVEEVEEEINGTWVKIGEKELKVIRYEFTHEQLKPLDEGFNPTVRSIITEMKILIKANSWVDAKFQRFREEERANRATRAIELNPVLSDKA